ncbi:MAG: acyl-CoA thioesterase [Saprospiraceae bacterium]|nr:acyl-CoA thioesterase [Saprospiraceae bacterium]
MFKHHIQIRVRYSETDQMGYVYYGNYSQYFEMGRVEAMRAMGIRYADLEKEHGIWMPVVSMHVRFLRPARYDDLLDVHTSVRWPVNDQIRFDTEIFNEQHKLLNAAHVILCFLNAGSGKKISIPDFVQQNLNTYLDIPEF